jgi:hypothetical protein
MRGGGACPFLFWCIIHLMAMDLKTVRAFTDFLRHRLDLGSKAVRPLQGLLIRGMDKKEVPNAKVFKSLLDRAKREGVQDVFIEPALGEGLYAPALKTIVLPSDKVHTTLAHELGHHQITKSRFGRLVQNPVTMLSGQNAALASLPAGTVSGYREEQGGEPFSFKKGFGKGVLVSGAIAAPMLGFEAWASKKGLRSLQQAGLGKAGINQARKSLARAWGTYGLIPVAGGANHLLGSLYGHSVGDDVRTAKAAFGEKPKKVSG